MEWQIGRHEQVKDGCYRYAIRDLNGRRKVALLVGAKKEKDPLHGVANCQLKLEGDQIIGINVDGDCALQVAAKKDWKKQYKKTETITNIIFDKA